MQQVVPFGVKISYYAFMAVMVPTYATHYNLLNFFTHCQVHLFLVLASFLTNKHVFISMSAVGILFPQSLWCLDFICVTLGIKFTGTTAYMYNEQLSRYLRFLSLFHFWFPFFLLYLIKRLGYDKRALYYQISLCVSLCLLSYNQIDLYNKNINLVQDFHIVTHLIGFPIVIFATHHFLIWWDYSNKKYI
jgi:hypothetical protein